MGLDQRIGAHFLQAGIGFGGSCFPKDVQALKQLAGNSGYHFQLLTAVIEVNHLQKRRVIGKLKERVGSCAASGWPSSVSRSNRTPTTCARPRPSCSPRACRARAPRCRPTTRWCPGPDTSSSRGVTICAEPLEAVRGADAVVLVTEWPEFSRLDWAAVLAVMRRPLVVDGRNFLDPEALARAGFTYEGVGVPAVRVPSADAVRAKQG